MKILYLSVHEILEYDELKLFTEMGHECYSMGAYTNPYGDEGRKRPGIPDMPFDPQFHNLAVRYSKDDLHPEMIEPMDVIMVMHEPSFIEKNWEKIRHKRVIWRSIGQSVPHIEKRLEPFRMQGLQVVRYSPAEATIEGNIGLDAMIRFYKDPDEFKDWNGDRDQVITIGQSMRARSKYCNFDAFKDSTEGLERKLFGPNNDDSGIPGGFLTYDEMKAVLRDSRVYFYTGTHPASYTLNFMEAMMTGIPIVAVGNRLGNNSDFPNQTTYEVTQIIKNGINGYYSDGLDELRKYVDEMLKNKNLAAQIGRMGRQKAIELFGKDQIKKDWKNFLGGK